MKQGKVWGSTEVIEINSMLEFHRADVKQGYQCSKHLHKYKWNGFYVINGELEVHRWKENGLVDVTILNDGEYTKVPPNEYHMFICNEDTILIELYWPEFQHEDIERETQGGLAEWSKAPHC